MRRNPAPNSRAAMMITIIWSSRLANGLLPAAPRTFRTQLLEISVDGDVATGSGVEADAAPDMGPGVRVELFIF